MDRMAPSEGADVGSIPAGRNNVTIEEMFYGVVVVAVGAVVVAVVVDIDNVVTTIGCD